MASIVLIGSAEKEIITNGKYKETGATALADNGITDVTSSLLITDDIVTGVEGTYTVTYTLPANITGGDDEVAVETVETRTVLVADAEGVIDTTFDLGDEDRKGRDIAGTKFDILLDAVDNDPEANPLPPEASAYFSETAMDPYERQHSKP